MSKSHTFRRSWQLFRSSLQILAHHRKLLIFPAVTLCCLLVITLFFLAPVVLVPTGHSWSQLAHWQTLASRWGEFVTVPANTPRWHPNTMAYLYLAVIYLAAMINATFFNVAFYHEILKALAGGPVSLRAGLAFASGRIRSILLWSLFAGAVGFIISALEKRFGVVGRFVMRLIGVTWSVASVFVIPIMVREAGTNPVMLLKTSAATLRKTWGEALIGYVGITLGAQIVVLGSVLLVVGWGGLAVLVDRPLLVVPVSIGWMLALMVFLYVVKIANDIFRCALYVYASEGVVPEPYTAELMDAAWKVRKS
jgi:hypothetical protein